MCNEVLDMGKNGPTSPKRAQKRACSWVLQFDILEEVVLDQAWPSSMSGSTPSGKTQAPSCSDIEMADEPNLASAQLVVANTSPPKIAIASVEFLDP